MSARRKSAPHVILIAGLTLVGALSSSSARAGYPHAEQIAFHDEDPGLVLVRSPFGLMLSQDDGHVFDWLSGYELRGLSATNNEYATLAVSTITSTGTFVTATSKGLLVSRDQGCSWRNTAKAPVFIDLATNPNDSSNVVALSTSTTRTAKATYKDQTRVWETKDDGQSWIQLGAAFPVSFVGASIARARTNPDRLYVTGRQLLTGEPGRSLLYVSNDHGTTWTATELPTTAYESEVFVAGVDPRDDRRVFLRSYAGEGRPARLFVHDTTDEERASSTKAPGAPLSTRILYDARGPILGFAFSPDGSRIFLGGVEDGLLVAESGMRPIFHLISDLPVTCLATRAPFSSRTEMASPDESLARPPRASELWACTHDRARAPQRFMIGVSLDEGRTFEMRLPSCSARGPLACPAIDDSTASPRAKLDLDCNAKPVVTSPSSPQITPAQSSIANAPAGRADRTSCAMTSSPPGPRQGLHTALGVVLAALAALLTRRVSRRARPRDRKMLRRCGVVE